MVFDVMPQPRHSPALPRVSIEVALAAFKPMAIAERRCPSCGWTDVRRSTAHHFNDYVLSVFGLVPYRCRTCSDRFHRTRQAAPMLQAGMVS